MLRHGIGVWARTIALAAVALTLTSTSGAEPPDGWHSGHERQPPQESAVDLLTHELQPIARGLGFRVNEASVKDQQLWVIGEIINTSHTTYSQVRLTLGLEYGAGQRLVIGRLVPGAKRRVQVRLATDFPHAPRELFVDVVEAIPDYRPKPQPWRPSFTPAEERLPSC